MSRHKHRLDPTQRVPTCQDCRQVLYHGTGHTIKKPLHGGYPEGTKLVVPDAVSEALEKRVSDAANLFEGWKRG